MIEAAVILSAWSALAGFLHHSLSAFSNAVVGFWKNIRRETPSPR